MKIYFRSTGHKHVLGITVMYIGFNQLEIDLGNVCTLTAVNCMFTHVEAYCLLKILLSRDKYFIRYQQNKWLLYDSCWIILDSNNVSVKSFANTTSSSPQHVFL